MCWRACLVTDDGLIYSYRMLTEDGARSQPLPSPSIYGRHTWDGHRTTSIRLLHRHDENVHSSGKFDANRRIFSLSFFFLHFCSFRSRLCVILWLIATLGQGDGRKWLRIWFRGFSWRPSLLLSDQLWRIGRRELAYSLQLGTSIMGEPETLGKLQISRENIASYDASFFDLIRTIAANSQSMLLEFLLTRFDSSINPILGHE